MKHSRPISPERFAEWDLNFAIEFSKELLSKDEFRNILIAYSATTSYAIPLIYESEEEKLKFFSFIKVFNLAYAVDHYIIATEAWLSQSKELPPSQSPDRISAVTFVSTNYQRSRVENFEKIQTESGWQLVSLGGCDEIVGRLTELLPPPELVALLDSQTIEELRTRCAPLLSIIRIFDGEGNESS